MITYRGWQMNLKNPIQDEVRTALEHYITKNGKPPQILMEVSDRLEDVPLPDGLNIVIKAQRMPKNILLIGVLE